ncbi:MAG: alpha-E domain-containing protein [Deltaproteobacteria bacterium]|nr:alpha-E domain-containing protein [Deltaproteobacteria bacterium]
MLSRVAESIYWMNRYVERAENVARFLDVSHGLALDLSAGYPEPWAALVLASGDDETFRRAHGEPTQRSVVDFLTFDKTNPSSILSCLRMARDNARSVREVLSRECWEQANKAYLLVADAATRKDALDIPHAFYEAVKQAAQLFVGMSYLTMTHDEGWHFGRLGRLVERADKTSRIVDVKYFILEQAPSDSDGRAQVAPRTYDEIQWAALLRCASGLQMYRRKHGLVEPAKVVDFLLFERKFPRSLRYCLTKAERSLHAITGTPLDRAGTRAEESFAELRVRFARESTDAVLASGLHGFVDAFQRSLNDVGNAIQQTFFTLRDGDVDAMPSIVPPEPNQ